MKIDIHRIAKIAGPFDAEGWYSRKDADPKTGKRMPPSEVEAPTQKNLKPFEKGDYHDWRSAEPSGGNKPHIYHGTGSEITIDGETDLPVIIVADAEAGDPNVTSRKVGELNTVYVSIGLPSSRGWIDQGSPTMQKNFASFAEAMKEAEHLAGMDQAGQGIMPRLKSLGFKTW